MTDDEATDQPAGRIPGRRPDTPPPRRTPPAPPAGGRGRPISVEISPRHIRLVPGQTDTAQVNVRYHGAVVDELTLSVTGDAAAWARVAPDSLNLYPDTQAQATIRFAPPRAPSPPAGLVELHVYVSSASDADASVDEQASIEIEPFDELSAAAQGSTSLSGKREAVLPIKVRNLGNRAATVGLQAVDAGGATTALSTASVALEPGAEASVWATVRPKASMPFGNPKIHPFTIVLNSQHSPPVTIDGRFEQLPSFGRLRLGVVGATAAALVGLGVVAVLAFPPRGPGATNSPTPTPTEGAVLTTAPPSTAPPPSDTATTAPPTGATTAPAETTASAETTAAPSTAAPSTEAPTTAAPTTPGPPTPVPTIPASFLKNGSWTFRDIDFDPISISGIDPGDIEQAGNGLTFSDGLNELIATWSLMGADRSITCRATYGPGDTLTVFDIDYSYRGLFADLFAGPIQEALCGAPFTLTQQTVPRQLLTTDLVMTGSNGTTYTWRRSQAIVIQTLPPIRP